MDKPWLVILAKEVHSVAEYHWKAFVMKQAVMLVIHLVAILMNSRTAVGAVVELATRDLVGVSTSYKTKEEFGIKKNAFSFHH